jgi:hypothetical protein
MLYSHVLLGYNALSGCYVLLAIARLCRQQVVHHCRCMMNFAGINDCRWLRSQKNLEAQEF